MTYLQRTRDVESELPVNADYALLAKELATERQNNAMNNALLMAQLAAKEKIIVELQKWHETRAAIQLDQGTLLADIPQSDVAAAESLAKVSTPSESLKEMVQESIASAKGIAPQEENGPSQASAAKLNNGAGQVVLGAALGRVPKHVGTDTNDGISAAIAATKDSMVDGEKITTHINQILYKAVRTVENLMKPADEILNGQDKEVEKARGAPEPTADKSSNATNDGMDENAKEELPPGSEDQPEGSADSSNADTSNNGAGQGQNAAKCSSNCNPAKCYGAYQDNSWLHGGLDCESDPVTTQGNNIQGGNGSSCLDNMSGGAFYAVNIHGLGGCYAFTSSSALARKTIKPTDPTSARYGVITKLFTTHPHGSGTQYGLIVGKRLMCSGTSCHVFKVGMCIKCPGPVFQSKAEQDVTQQDINKFVNCCVLGHSKETKSKGKKTNQMSHCPSGWSSTDANGNTVGAFTAFNTASSTLKESYRCWNGTNTDVDGKKAQDSADAIITAA